MSEQLITAPNLADRLGVRTSTLAKWRQLGTGPAGWFYLSATCVAYPAEEVERFLAARRANPVRRGRPPKRAESSMKRLDETRAPAHIDGRRLT